MPEDILVGSDGCLVVCQRELLVSKELINAVGGTVLFCGNPELLVLPERCRAVRIESPSGGDRRAVVFARIPLALLAIRVAGELLGIFAQSCRALSVGASRAGWVRNAELVGVEQQRRRIGYLQRLLLLVQAVLSREQSIDETVPKGSREGLVLALCCLDLVEVFVLVLV